MIAPAFLTMEEALAIRQRMIDEFGGMPGVVEFFRTHVVRDMA